MRVSNVFIMYILFLSNHEHSIKSFPRRVPDCFVLYTITLHHKPLIHPGPERKPGERIFKKAISKQNKLSVISAFYSCVHFWLRYSWILPIECFHSRGQHLRKFIRTKESVCIRNGVQLPQDWFGTTTWPPFHCFGTPIWPPWRHVKTLYRIF